MSFWLKTKNINIDIRKSNPISGVNLDINQLLIYLSSCFIGFIIIFFLNIWILWKALMVFILFILTITLTKKYDDSNINWVDDDFGKTYYQWFKIFLRKIISGNKSINKWSNYEYFNKK